MSTPKLIITINDLIPPRGHYCSWGVRRWFNDAGLDFKAFIEFGIDAEVLIQTNDHLAICAVRNVENLNGKR